MDRGNVNLYLHIIDAWIETNTKLLFSLFFCELIGVFLKGVD